MQTAKAGMTLKTVREIANDSRQSDSTIRKWIKAGKFPVYRPGGKILIDPADFNRFLTDSKRRIAVDPDVKAMICGMFKRTA